MLHTREVSTAGIDPALTTVQALIAQIDPSTHAVAAADATLTYGELSHRAEAVAAALRAHGVQPGSLVAVCLPRSAALVVASLGILRAGAAYVALDPAAPRRRIADLIEDSGAAVLIAEPGLIGSIAGSGPADAVDGVGAIAAVNGDRAPVLETGLAYVIFTSGSTGRPKGVLVEQAGLVNLARWHGRSFDVGPGVRCSLIGGPGFDAAAWEMWGCLVNGGTLVIPPERLKSDPGGLRDWLIAQQVSVSFVPTPLAETLLALTWPDRVPLRFLLTGGDRLHRAPREGLDFALVNNYGVTEASVVTTSAPVAPGSGTPSIGRPIDGVDIVIVDTESAPVAPGEPGELLVGGVSVARGYLGPAELTATRFVGIDTLDGRWYRTGDLVRQRPDGEIDYLGRVDDQVQIRGNRVEPGEIVAALDRHPDIVQSVVCGVEDAAGQPRLIAFVQSVDGSDAGDGALREHLASWLLVHMVPAVFVQVDEMPLTTNGKVDRALLLTLVPDSSRPDADAVDDELEATTAHLIADVLGLPTIGVDENFLLAGGHSLLGAQLVGRLAELFGVEVSLRELFDAPTAAGMAELVREHLVAQVLALDDETAASLAEPLTDAR